VLKVLFLEKPRSNSNPETDLDSDREALFSSVFINWVFALFYLPTLLVNRRVHGANSYNHSEFYPFKEKISTVLCKKFAYKVLFCCCFITVLTSTIAQKSNPGPGMNTFLKVVFLLDLA